MELKHVTLDTENMSYKEVNDMIQELRVIRTRKKELHERVEHLQLMVSHMKDEDMAWVNKYTGEVLDPDDWTLYDERTRTFYSEEEKDGNTNR